MKAIVTFLFLLPALLVCGQVPEMLVKDSTLLRAIDIFIDSISSHKFQSKEFVIEAHISKLVETTMKQDPETLEWSPSEHQRSYELALLSRDFPLVSIVPLCKFHYGSREVYMFFGANNFVEYSERDLKKLERREFRKHKVTLGSNYLLFFQIENEEIHVLTSSNR